MLEAIPKFSAPPDGVVVANAFTSLQESSRAHTGGFLWLMTWLMPDWWNNVDAVRRVHSPLMIIHSESDEALPVEGARTIFEAASEPKKLQILQGFGHNALRKDPTDAWWGAPLQLFREDYESSR